MNVKRITDQLSLEYSNSPVIRGVLSAISSANPISAAITPAFDILLTHNASKIQERRSKLLVETLLQEIDKYSSSKIDANYFETEEWNDLLVSALNKASQTRSNDKIELFSKILSGAVLAPERTVNAETYLEVVNELSVNELLVANLVFKSQGAHSPNPEGNGLYLTTREGWGDLQKYCADQKLDEAFLLQRIAKTGLIKESTGLADYNSGHFMITQTFKELMEFIQGKP